MQRVPSHGRGRRFNPYSAHHFPRLFSAPLGTNRHQPAEPGTPRRGEDVECVPRLFPGCACKSDDAYDCWALRYHHHTMVPGMVIDREGGPCECACHDAVDDESDAGALP